MPLQTRTLIAAAITVVAVGYGAATAEPAVPTDRAAGTISTATLAAAAAPTDGQETAARPAVAARPIAQVDGIVLTNPQPGSPLAGFHQASYSDALPMENTGDSLQLPSRGRPTAPTSALDVVGDGQPVLAPVTGRVSAVRTYDLYGEHPDARIEITPAGRPDRTVVVLHVTGPTVTPGQTVVAGASTIAEHATAFPFESQIDRFVDTPADGPTAHVHIEVKAR